MRLFRKSEEENYFYVSRSSISDIGEGLFTLKDIKKGERICKFGGRLIGKQEFDKILDDIKIGIYDPNAENYYVSLSSGLILDSFESDCFAKYANDAEGIIQVERFKNNAKITEGEDKISAYHEALIDIPAGSEIFTSYGTSYWEGFK